MTNYKIRRYLKLTEYLHPATLISCHNFFWIAFLSIWGCDFEMSRALATASLPSPLLQCWSIMPLRRCASKISESNIEMGGRGCFTRSWFKIHNFYSILTSNIKSCDNNYVAECLKMSLFQESPKWIQIPIVSKTLITMTANRKILLAVAGLHQLFDVRCKSLQCSVVNIIICR